MDPHLPEYLAAAEALADQTMPPRRTYAVGDYVNGVAGGRRFSGHIMTIDDRRVSVDCAGAWIVCSPEDLDF
jgi:hypothetical protein